MTSEIKQPAYRLCNPLRLRLNDQSAFTVFLFGELAAGDQLRSTADNVQRGPDLVSNSGCHPAHRIEPIRMAELLERCDPRCGRRVECRMLVGELLAHLVERNRKSA